MSRRRNKDYLAVFRSLLHLLPSTSVQKCVADLEKGLWNALRQLFPGIPIKGCVFHWCQAIFRKIQKSGLAVSYNSKGNTYTFPRKLMALPFLSREHIPLAFNKLKETAQGHLHTVVRYVDKMY
jgi:transposase-like protein